MFRKLVDQLLQNYSLKTVSKTLSDEISPTAIIKIAAVRASLNAKAITPALLTERKNSIVVVKNGERLSDLDELSRAVLQFAAIQKSYLEGIGVDVTNDPWRF